METNYSLLEIDRSSAECDPDCAFHKIYEDFQPKILRYVAHLAGEEEAEDLAQEVFIKASQALPGFRGESSLSTWLYRIATNCAYDRMRSSSFRHQVESFSSADGDEACVPDEGVPDISSGDNAALVEQQLVRQEMSQCILSYVGRLPEIYRAVLVLSDLEEVGNKEIAEILGVSLEVVKVRLHRARALLREQFLSTCEYYWLSELSWPAI